MPRKDIWITGAGSGIGRALARRLAAQGHRVYASGRRREVLDDLVREAGPRVIPLPCDVTRDDDMAGLFERHNIYRLDCAIFCAGVCEYIDYPRLDMDVIRRVTQSNYFGLVNACIAALPALRRRAAETGAKTPHIVGVGSMSSYLGFPRAEAYGASKAAMSYFLDALRCDLGETIDVTIVYPGFVDTPMTAQNDFPMPFLMAADKAADRILKRLERRPRSVAIPRRLHWLLRLMQWLPGFWYGPMMNRLRRPEVRP